MKNLLIKCVIFIFKTWTGRNSNSRREYVKGQFVANKEFSIDRSSFLLMCWLTGNNLR